MQMHGRILRVRRDDMQITSARIIFAKLLTEDENVVDVGWVDPEYSPTLLEEAKKYGRDFEEAWKHAKEGMNVSFECGVHGFSLVR